MPFEIRFEDHVWRTEDLTLDEAVRIEQATGRSWMLINPFRYGIDAREVIVTFLARNGESFDGAKERVGKLKIGEVIDAFHIVPEDLPDVYEDGIPKAEAAPETDGSSPAPNDSDGPPT